MRATKDALILDEKELSTVITNDKRVHFYNVKPYQIKSIKSAMTLLLEQDPNNRTAKKINKEIDFILKELKK